MTPPARANPGFALTLAHLERLYGQTRTALLAEVEGQGVERAAAQEAIQESFALAAKRRFTFRSEAATALWLRGEIHGHAHATRPAVAAPAPVFEWSDVLRRANILASQPLPLPENHDAQKGRLRALLRMRLRPNPRGLS
jgi:hypothetical protein